MKLSTRYESSIRSTTWGGVRVPMKFWVESGAYGSDVGRFLVYGTGGYICARFDSEAEAFAYLAAQLGETSDPATWGPAMDERTTSDF